MIIENYYKESNILPLLLKNKLAMFERNKDIALEFETWIQTGKYIKKGCVEVEGYTAESLSKISHYLDGEAAFILLIELRENPTKALERISRGFKMK